MKPKLFIFALLALLVASCTDEIDIPEPAAKEEKAAKAGEMVTIEASIPPDTRVAYDDSDGSLSWQSGDKLRLAAYNGDTYIGSSIFTWTGTGNTFSGTLVEGATPATVYKAYYPAEVITLDDNGNVQPLPAGFWRQKQYTSNGKGHLRSRILLRDEAANPLNEPFELTLNSCIVKFELENMPRDIESLKSVIWTVVTTSGETRSAILDVDGVKKPIYGVGPTPFNVTVYIAFDPDFMQVAAGGKVKITLIGDKSYEWSGTSQNGKTYTAGKRYNATVSAGWTEIVPFIFTIKTGEPNRALTLYQVAAAYSPANLTIDWGDGSENTTIQHGASLGGTIAQHAYQKAGDYTVTIYSSNTDYSSRQIPQLIFKGNPWLTAVLTPFPNMGAQNFDDRFYHCTQLATIPADLFRHNSQARSFVQCFQNCSGLTSIPADLFKYNTNATNFLGCFRNCTGLTSIPTDLFKHNTLVTDFYACFQDCSGLTSIPAALFRNNELAENFGYCFCDCSGLTSIPTDLFKYNTNATVFQSCFSYCAGLTEIPVDLFKENTNAANFFWCFRDCTGLTSVPAELFKYNTNATNFVGCFLNCTGLTTLPTDLFKYNTNATDFTVCFYNCTGLTTVPANLFRYNEEATTFSYCFYDCTGLTTLPTDLFTYNTKVTDFSHCFSGCTKLELIEAIFPDPTTNANFFAGREMNFTGFCKNVGTAATTQGTAPELWRFNYGAGVTSTDCFTGITTNLTNYNDIPASWGGGGS
jgi:hypothetical protein